MKAISVKQPWANMIRWGQKTIETRTWYTPYRGELLIVSSATPKIMPAGCALALVDMVDCRRMVTSDQAYACCEIYDSAFAWIFRDIRPIRPVKIKGRLGIYEAEIDPEFIKLDEFWFDKQATN